jgi:hypothetical protein
MNDYRDIDHIYKDGFNGFLFIMSLIYLVIMVLFAPVIIIAYVLDKGGAT